LTLDWYPIFNAAPGQAGKLLRIIRNDSTANPPAWPDNQRANPMLPIEDDLVHIEEKVN
jgi:hypothetical protein